MNPMIKKKQELVYIALAGFTVTFNTFEQTIVLVLHGGISVAQTLAQNASVHLSLRLSLHPLLAINTQVKSTEVTTRTHLMA